MSGIALRAEAFRRLQEVATASFSNEKLTRERVAGLEAILHRGFWGRLRWLFMGK